MANGPRSGSANPRQAARARWTQALAANPNDPEALFQLGLVAADEGQFGQAAAFFSRASDAGLSDARLHTHFAKALVSVLHIEKAQQHAEFALKANPRDALTLDTLGVVLTKLQRHAEAVRCFSAAVKREPNDAGYRLNLANSLQFVGRLAEAEAAYRKALALDPRLTRALVALPYLSRQTRERSFLPQLRTAFAAAPDTRSQLLIGHALAKTYEDFGDFADSAKWLSAAKAGAKAWQDAAWRRDAALFESAARALDAPHVRVGDPFEAPIFIVGMPRTGTTLTERVLSSHPMIHSAGELNDFSMAAKRVAGTHSRDVLDPLTLDKASGADPAEIGRLYAHSTAMHTTERPRFVDKMPINFFYTGLIHRALPNARIICVRRHPMDACLANYRQILTVAPSLYDYAHDLEALGRYYAAFDRLIAHCRRVLPADRFTEIWYEDLVTDIEGEARRLLDFSGLAWDERCIAFHENASAIPTGSSVQARQPLYATSIGRWRRYGEAVDLLRAALDREGVDLSPRG